MGPAGSSTFIWRKEQKTLGLGTTGSCWASLLVVLGGDWGTVGMTGSGVTGSFWESGHCKSKVLYCLKYSSQNLSGMYGVDWPWKEESFRQDIQACFTTTVFITGNKHIQSVRLNREQSTNVCRVKMSLNKCHICSRWNQCSMGGGCFKKKSSAFNKRWFERESGREGETERERATPVVQTACVSSLR